MSSSPSPAPAAAEPMEVAASAPPLAAPFLYEEVELRPGLRNFPLVQVELPPEVPAPELPPPEEPAKPPDPPPVALVDPQRDAEQRELGRQQGLGEARAKFEEQLAAERAAIPKALADFSRERAGYYRRLEEETVQLAMAIARKVIHREAQVDPLLLMGIVRVALERIEGATGVVVEVHPEEVPEWRRYLGARLDPAEMPEIKEDAALGRDRCRLRTAMGTAEMGLEVQLKEVEQGLTDLLKARPE